jgi:hypothetical protein
MIVTSLFKRDVTVVLKTNSVKRLMRLLNE